MIFRSYVSLPEGILWVSRMTMGTTSPMRSRMRQDIQRIPPEKQRQLREEAQRRHRMGHWEKHGGKTPPWIVL